MKSRIVLTYQVKHIALALLPCLLLQACETTTTPDQGRIKDGATEPMIQPMSSTQSASAASKQGGDPSPYPASAGAYAPELARCFSIIDSVLGSEGRRSYREEGMKMQKDFNKKHSIFDDDYIRIFDALAADPGLKRSSLVHYLNSAGCTDVRGKSLAIDVVMEAYLHNLWGWGVNLQTSAANARKHYEENDDEL